jgi:hypothetical protein
MNLHNILDINLIWTIEILRKINDQLFNDLMTNDGMPRCIGAYLIIAP